MFLHHLQAVYRVRFAAILAAVLAILTSLLAVACGPGSAGQGQVATTGTPRQVQTPLPISERVTVPQVQMSLASQGARFERISTAEGLSFFIVRAILQDRQGFMWIGTFGGGLTKYDGYGFTVYKHTPGDPRALSHHVVQAICEDRDGNLWVGTMSGLDRLDRATGTFTHYLQDRGPTFAIYEDSAGMLWVGTGSGLIVFDRATGTIARSYRHDPSAPGDSQTLSSDTVWAIYPDRRGELWIGTTGGLDRLTLGKGEGADRTTGTFTHYRHDPGDPGSLSQDAVQVIYEDRQGALWVGTFSGGLNRLDRSSGTFTRYQHNPEDVERSLSDNGVRAILEDSAGMLWVGTLNGLDVFAPSVNSGRDLGQGHFLHYRHDPADPHSLSDDGIWALYEDRSGVVWIGTLGNGLSKYNRRANQFAHYQKRPDYLLDVAGTRVYPVGTFDRRVLSDSKVLSIYEDREGVLWIGTFSGGLDKLDRRSGQLTVYQHDPADPASLSSNTVYAVYEDHRGVLWVGTQNGWLERYDPQTETFIHHWCLGTQVEKITETRSGELWIGTPTGLYRLDGDRDRLSHYLGDHDIQAIYADQTGALWVGTFAHGLYLWDPGGEGFTHYRHDPDDAKSLGRDGVLAFHEDATMEDGVVWIGTWGGGLDRFDRATQTFAHYTENDGLPDDSVGCILADAEGFLWLGTIKGLSKFDPRTETFRNYDERDGVLTGGSGVGPGLCFKSKRGEMFLGRSDGFDAFYPEQIAENLHVPPIAITAFDVFNQTVRRDLLPGEHIRLSHQENTISFEYAALDYAVPEKNQYAYIMEGLDEDWVYAGTRRHADYPGLRAGDYVFRVKGSNSDGIWNEQGTAVHITITPPFWQTVWFRAVVALVVGGSAIAGYRLRVRSIEARSRELEKQVEARTAELRREIDQRTQVEEALRQREMEQAVAAERSRLARELHDAVTQTLFSASLIAEALPTLWERDREMGRERLAMLRQMSRGALAEMRTLLLELRPAALVETSLEDLLRQLGEAVTGRAGVPVTVEVEGRCELPADLHVALYRIAQEALNNVVKHARASQVAVRLRCTPRVPSPSWGEGQKGGVQVELAIRDDGRGFDPGDVPPERMGLGIMRERAEAVGAQLGIVSQAGQGTRLAVVWPGDRGRRTADN